jgi:pimeloyl-ACP methyl ester carboxylesterase
MKEVSLLKKVILIWGLCLLSSPVVLAEESDKIDRPWPGKKSSFHSFDQYDFKIEGFNCKVAIPDNIAAGKPWIWRARFWGHEPQTDKALLRRGFHVVYANVAGLWGSPKAVKRWDAFYKYLVESQGFDKKAVLEGMSRGGLIIYNWAAQNPEKVHCIYADAPVCNFNSCPAINKAIMSAYGLTQEQAKAYTGNPIDNLNALAKANIPLLHVVGDADTVVPVSENTAIIEKRYKALGGHIQVIHKKDVGHHPHSLKDPKPIVDFILKCAQQENSSDKK